MTAQRSHGEPEIARRSWSVVAACCLAVMLLAGCAGYRVGPTGGQVAGARSIRVPFVSNRTLEPRLAEPATQSLRRILQQDGTFRLSTSGDDADVEVRGTITAYDRRPLAYQPKDVASVQEYELRMTVRVVAKDLRTGAVLLDQDVRARTTVSAGADQTSVERQAIPLLATDFARKATTLLAEGSW